MAARGVVEGDSNTDPTRFRPIPDGGASDNPDFCKTVRVRATYSPGEKRIFKQMESTVLGHTRRGY